jgi:hypothetical protein
LADLLAASMSRTFWTKSSATFALVNDWLTVDRRLFHVKRTILTADFAFTKTAADLEIPWTIVST